MNAPVIVPPRRSLTKKQRVDLFDSHGGVCVICKRKIKAGEKWIDEHINPRAISADDSLPNRGPAHVSCAQKKTKKDRRDIAKVIRMRAKHLGIRNQSRFPASRNSRFKKKITGEVVER
jgi:5-methylcytosine-specific restriction protein A